MEKPNDREMDLLTEEQWAIMLSRLPPIPIQLTKTKDQWNGIAARGSVCYYTSQVTTNEHNRFQTGLQAMEITR